MDGQAVATARTLPDAPREEGRTPVEVLGRFVSELRLEDIPPNVLAHARLAVLDTLGAAIAAARSAEAGQILEAMTDASGSGRCAVWGTSASLPPAPAALANGSLAHLLELDDFGGCGHSGAVVVPAVLAVAVAEGRSGRDALTAVVAGYEVASRILAAAGGYRAHNGRGWHSTGTCGAFGSAAAAARTVSLDAGTTASAIAIGGSLAAGLWAFEVDGAITKRLHAGRAADNGVTAAYLARRGARGPLSVLEAPYGGFLATFGDGAADGTGDLAQATAGLGTEWHTLRSGFKIHAACRGVHGLLDALLDLRAEHGLEPEAIAGVEVTAGADAIRRLGKTEVVTPLQAQLSLPYAAAVALLFGTAGPEQFDAACIERDDVARMMARVRFEPSPGSSHVSAVTVETAGGVRLRRSVGEARGGPGSPLSEREVVAKFERLVGPWLPADRPEQIVELVQGLENRRTLDRLDQLLLTPAA